jgi:ribonuclease BN (tRNA processing enzyme)
MILALLPNFMVDTAANGRDGSKGKPVTLTILGTGDAFASGGRAQAGYLLEAAGKRILLEAGPGVLTEMKRHGIDADSLDAIIISHLHGDHFSGLPFLFLEYMWERPRKHPVIIAGPKNLEKRTWILMRAMFSRFNLKKLQTKVKWIVLEPGKSAKIAGLKVSTIRSPHTKPDISLSIKIAADGKTFVFSGDSGWNDELVHFSAGANLLLCECTYYESDHLRFHMNYPELKRNRDRFDVQRMILTHLGRETINHTREIEIEMGFDGMKLEI